MGISKRQVALRFGFNSHTVELLLKQGALCVLPGGTPRRPKISEDSLKTLQEGAHYVVCLECGAFQGQITSKHLQSCSGISLSTYRERHPDAKIMSAITVQNRIKSEDAREAQSQKLKARFKTEAGEKTRQQIACASRQMQQSGYREKAVEHLRRLNANPEQRAARGRESRTRWATREHRNKLQIWQQENRDAVLASAANARRHIGRKRSKPHMQFKQAMNEAGLTGFMTEYEVGYYAIDEGHPDLKIAIEVDGCYWHGCEECGFPGVGDIRNLDRRKTTYLTRRGWTIVRIKEHDIKTNIDGCIERVCQVVDTARRGAA